MTENSSPLLKMDLTGTFRGFALMLASLALTWNLAVSWKVFRNEPLREGGSRALMAASSSFFYDSGLAEPVPVAALKLAMYTGAGHDALMRMQGMAALVAVFLLTLFVLRRYGEAAGTLAALFVAANPYMGYYAMQGSSHLFALAFLLLFWYYFDSPEGGRKHAVLAGAAGGLACLSRLDAAWFLIVMAGLSWAVKRREFRLKEAGLSLGLALLLTLPYVAWQKAQYGRFLYAQELSLNRWANIDESGYGPGKSRPQAPLSVTEFVFRRGPAGAVRDAFSGLGRSLAYELPRIIYYKFLTVLIFLGVYAAFLRGRDRLLFFLAAALLPVLPLAPISQVLSVGGIELRYYLWTLWAFCALAGLGFQETADWGVRSLNNWAAAKMAGKKG